MQSGQVVAWCWWELLYLRSFHNLNWQCWWSPSQNHTDCHPFAAVVPYCKTSLRWRDILSNQPKLLHLQKPKRQRFTDISSCIFQEVELPAFNLLDVPQPTPETLSLHYSDLQFPESCIVSIHSLVIRLPFPIWNSFGAI